MKLERNIVHGQYETTKLTILRSLGQCHSNTVNPSLIIDLIRNNPKFEYLGRDIAHGYKIIPYEVTRVKGEGICDI